MSLDAMEKLIILEAYKFFRFNKTATSQSLGIAIRTLDNKIEQYNKQALEDQERQANDKVTREQMMMRHRGNPPNNVGIPFSPGVITVSAPPVISTPIQPAVVMNKSKKG
jgi:hypothetical protein